MSTLVRFVAIAITFTALAITDANATGRRLFGGRLLPHARFCQPIPIIECVPPPVKKEDEEPLPHISKDLAVNVKNIAELLQHGKKERATRLAQAVAPQIDDLADLMHLYRPRNKGGLGFGTAPYKNPATDGLEKKVQEFAKGLPAQVPPEQVVEGAYWIAAMAELTTAKAPGKDLVAKSRTKWFEQSGNLREAAHQMAAAATAKDSAAFRLAAARVNSACMGCHAIFK